MLDRVDERLVDDLGDDRCRLGAFDGGDGAVVDAIVTDEGVEVTATVRTADRTGVEMEALTAVAVAALAIVDMVKGMDKATAIENVRLIAKTGGKSGDWTREA